MVLIKNLNNLNFTKQDEAQLQIMYDETKHSSFRTFYMNVTQEALAES